MEQRVSQSANAFADVVFLRVSVADLIAWWREEHADVSPAAADSPDVIKPKKEVLLPLPVSNEASRSFSSAPRVHDVDLDLLASIYV